MRNHFRHAVLTCGYVRAIDSHATLPTQRGARRIAQALGWVLVGVLCVAPSVASASANGLSNKSLAYYYINDIKEYKCFQYIIEKESKWNHKADNPKSSAYGLGQLLGEKSKDAFEQIVRSVAYGHHRYGTLCRAAAFHRAHGWW